MLPLFDFAVVQAAWERYVVGSEAVPPTIEGVRQAIVDSWRRSKNYVDPMTSNRVLPNAQLQKRQADNAPLIQIARPYLQTLFQYLKESEHQITIVDQHGCILDTIFDDSQSQEHPTQFRIGNGTLFAEAEAGTNGIALCLLSEEASVIYGPEHFKKGNHSSVCYTAPIHDQFHKLIGVVDISGPLDSYQPSIPGMLRSSVQGIEREFSFRQINAVLSDALDAFTAGILVLNADKIIIHHNAKAQEVLQVGTDILIGQPIYSVLRQDSLPAPAQSLKQRISSMECTILNRYQTLLDVTLTVIPSGDGNGPDTSFIQVETQSELTRLAYRGNDFSAHYTFDSILGDSSAVQSLKALGAVAATTPIPVLIFGEPGTGKDVVAQAIHNSSQWADGPFVCLDCSKIPRALLESELFGYEGGVFCGGKENGYTGKFEQANGGTLFLNEINYLPQEAQEALMHILQTGTVTRLGGKYAKSITCKLIVATTVNLLTAVQRKTFRADLYYRLNALTITIPPLRERKQDILPIAKHFIAQHCFEGSKPLVSLDPEVIAVFQTYSWPNNIREVETIVGDALHIAEDAMIRLSDLPTALLTCYYAKKDKRAQSSEKGESDSLGYREKEAEPYPSRHSQVHFDDYQKTLDALRANYGNVRQTAEALNVPLSTLYYKLKKYALNAKAYKH